MDYKFYVGFAIIGLVVGIVTAVQPVFKDTTSNITAIQGDDVILPCTVLNTSANIEVNWTSPNGEQLTYGENVLLDGDRYSVERQSTTNWNLKIKAVYISDSGTYVCEIKSDTPQRKSVHFTVKATTVIQLVGSGDKTTQSSTTLSPTTEDPNICSGIRPCRNSGICVNGTCTCTKDFIGSFCEEPTVCPLNACNINNTKNCSVELENGSFVYKCKCLPFYKGDHCERYDFCVFYPCENKGRCEPLYPQNSYKCHCLLGDPNNDCKLNKRDNCLARPPSNPNAYITCIDQIDSYKMYCSPGYSGEKTGCSKNENLELYCDRSGPGYCTDEGYCKPLCNANVCNGIENCKFTADPYNTTGFDTKSDCVQAFGDGYDHPNCHAEDTLFDGFDAKINGLKDCSPFFDTVCTRDFGNGDCKPGCNNADCLFDGFDCLNVTELAGVVVVEFKGQLEAPLNALQNNMSMMLRSGVSLTEETFRDEPMTILSLRITETEFTDIEYAGKFLAAAVAKRPGWLDGVKIKDIFVCPAGSYSSTYSDKCRRKCSTCIQDDDVCDWKTGACLYGCLPAHSGEFCKPCDACKQKGEVCDPFSGECLHGCKSGHWGHECVVCFSCKQEGDICNNVTGECLHGCINNNFYGAMCKQCPQNCVGGCNENGHCNTCPSDRHGKTCEKLCDEKCRSGTCTRNTGICECKDEYYWSDHDKRCVNCSDGCKGHCNVSSGSCICRDGYYGSKCIFHCMDMCLNGTCHVNGTCDKGCDPGYYGPTCANACPSGCNACSRESGLCEGNCKPGYEGSKCEKSAGRSGYIDDVTDNTGVIIGVIISLLLVVLILLVACCYWKKRKSGDYVMEDEEMEEPPPKETNTIHVHTNMHMQPTSPLLGHSSDMIELDEKQNVAVYAGPGPGQTAENGDKMPDGKGPEEKEPEADKGQPTDDNSGDASDNKAEDTDKKNERCTSSVVMEIGTGGRVLSVSDGDEAQSPTLNKEAELPIGEEEESMEDDSVFANPPQSPLGEVRAPLASEENILASLGPKEIERDTADEPVGLDEELAKEEDKESKRSRSSSSSSSSSNSSKSSKKDNHAVTTEM
ncbi:multiple epidermal growth factor-like domains protein 10 [Mercenaria mercenaria]|uniref:multiple epidermal growth factor-like domains protein 10 n=1 Tax=Mercenaria mercenaria TaxID=6596 RepID=UPI00234EFB83|nr:multiple epidermal growth factor-like domains protein 10 [Mercenaria mercenaria]